MKKKEEQKIVNINEVLLRNFVDKIRPAIELRDKVDIGYTFDPKVVEIYEIRPVWDKPKEKQYLPVAKIKYINSTNSWKIYWFRANGKWAIYVPQGEINNFAGCLEIVEADDHHCFWG